jgi:DNA-binding NtrC family response regulator
MENPGRIFRVDQGESISTVRTKIEALEDLHKILSVALDDIKRLKFSESAKLPDIKPGLDFYREVRRFEIALIQQALRHSGGRQTLAASLLGIKTTTLNSKIKSYNIDWKKCAS